jgi:H+/Cl- antiporter ClcA
LSALAASSVSASAWNSPGTQTQAALLSCFSGSCLKCLDTAFNWVAFSSGTCFYARPIHVTQLSAKARVDIFFFRPYTLFVGLGLSFSLLVKYTVFRTPWTGDQPAVRPLPTHRTTQTQNKHAQTFMPAVGFELTISVLERSKTVHAIDISS